MYLWIALLLQNKLLIWRPLGYCELSVQSFNMLFSLLTAADFLYHQFWEFDSWSRQSLPTHHNYAYFQHLLGNLLKEVRRNNMLITLELKKTSASFQNLPTLICVLRILNFSCTFLLRTCNTVKRKKHCSKHFGNVRFNCGCYCITRFCVLHCFSKLIYFSFHWLLEIQPHHFHRLMVKALTVLY